MEVTCPNCRAHLLLPAQAVGQSVSCPKCHAVLVAEPDRLVAREGITAPTPPAPRPLAATEPPPELDDDRLDLTIPAGHVFPGQRNAEILRNLSWTGLWMRIVAVADIASIFLVVAVANLGPGGRLRPLDEGAIAGVLCGLILVGPVAVLLWVAGGRLRDARLEGSLHQPAQLIGVLVGLFACLIGVFALVDTVRSRQATALAATLIASGASAATLLICIVGIVVRRQAIAARLPQRIGDSLDREVGRDVPPDIVPPYRTAQRQARHAAWSLRLASLLLVIWYPLSCWCCATSPLHPRDATVFWMVLLWAAGLLPLALMLGGAYYLEALQRRGAAMAGAVAAFAAGLVFAIDFIASLVHLAQLPPQLRDVLPLVLLRSAMALAVAISSIVAGIHAWRAVHDPEVRRAFMRNR